MNYEVTNGSVLDFLVNNGPKTLNSA